MGIGSKRDSHRICPGIEAVRAWVGHRSVRCGVTQERFSHFSRNLLRILRFKRRASVITNLKMGSVRQGAPLIRSHSARWDREVGLPRGQERKQCPIPGSGHPISSRIRIETVRKTGRADREKGKPGRKSMARAGKRLRSYLETLGTPTTGPTIAGSGRGGENGLLPLVFLRCLWFDRGER